MIHNEHAVRRRTIAKTVTNLMNLPGHEPDWAGQWDASHSAEPDQLCWRIVAIIERVRSPIP